LKYKKCRGLLQQGMKTNHRGETVARGEPSLGGMGRVRERIGEVSQATGYKAMRFRKQMGLYLGRKGKKKGRRGELARDFGE